MENTVSTVSNHHLEMIKNFLRAGFAIEFRDEEGRKAELVMWKDQHIVRATEVKPIEEKGIFVPPIRMAAGVNLPQKPGLSFLLGQFAPDDFFLEVRSPTDSLKCCRERKTNITELIELV